MTKSTLTRPRLDLREQLNPGCLSCDRVTRKEFLDNGLCKQTVSVLDQLPIRCVGGWSYDKIYRLVKYFGIFANGMKNAWEGLNYVEICSGPGRCVKGNRRDGHSPPSGSRVPAPESLANSLASAATRSRTGPRC